MNLKMSEADFSTQNLKDKDNLNIIEGTKFLSYKMSLRTFIDIEEEEVMKHIYGLFIIESNYRKFYQKIFDKVKNNLDLYKLNKKYYFRIFNMKIFVTDFMENLDNILKTS